MNPYNEDLIKAEQTANLLVSDLKAAYTKSNPLTEIIVMPLLEQAAKLEQALKALNKAMKSR